jgi:Holliday junction resolvase
MRTYTLSRIYIDTEHQRDCCGDINYTNSEPFLIIKCNDVPIRFASVKSIESSRDIFEKLDTNIFTVEDILDVLCKSKLTISHDMETL